MKIERKILRYTESSKFWKKDDIKEIKAIVRIFCCDNMEDAWDDKYVGFGEFDTLLNKNDNVNIYKCNPWPEDAVWEECAINFCPFCGERIEIIDIPNKAYVFMQFP